MIQFYNDLMPEIIDLMKSIISLCSTEKMEIILKIENINGRWFVTESVMSMEEEMDITL